MTVMTTPTKRQIDAAAKAMQDYGLSYHPPKQFSPVFLDEMAKAALTAAAGVGVHDATAMTEWMEKQMTFQEILEGITQHRANRLVTQDVGLERKIDEIEWALQALAERLRDITSPTLRNDP